MRKLNKIITGDIYNNDHWTQLKKHLVDRMADPDEELSVCFITYLPLCAVFLFTVHVRKLLSVCNVIDMTCLQ